MDLASAKKMVIVHYLLEKGASSQYQAKKNLKLGMSTVNQTFNFLEEKEVLKKENGKYVVVEPVSLLELVAFFRNMNSLKVLEVSTSLEKEQVLKLLPKTVVFCLETALEQYSNYYKSNKVCFYAGEKASSALKPKLAVFPGTKTQVVAFKQKPKFLSNQIFKDKAGLRFTEKIQTVIDLYCDKKGNEAEALVNALWGKKT
ncbi:MAG: hypothetical protein V1847_00425 [Candidatus Diapherotrites archaeon]